MDVLEDICANIHGGRIGNIILKVKTKIQPIYALHQNLRERLIAAADVYLKGSYSMGRKTTNLGEVFLDMRHKFLAYAPFLDLIINARKAIDILKLDDAGRKDFEQIERMMRENANMKESSSIPTNLDSLFARPVQQVMRYVRKTCDLFISECKSIFKLF